MRAAIYCRLSEEDRDKSRADDDSASIQNQKSMLLRYLDEQGWTLYDIYSDDDFAGADRRRPAFNRLLRDAEARRFDIVLCKTQSRFTRELELVEKYIHGLFPVWGIRFVSIVDNADTAHKGNKKARQINGLVNEWYLEDMSENIRSVLNDRRKQGLHIGAFALYGYQKDPARRGHLLIDEDAAETVREVFSLFAAGCGKTAIARMLNDRGVPSPAVYRQQKGLAGLPPDKSVSLWRYSTVADMLRNRIYMGDMVQGRYGSISYKTKQNKPRPKSDWFIVEGTHEPIIDRALWDKVQAALEARQKPFAGGRVGLFAGKARCAHCGYLMRSSQSKGRHYLSCATRYAASNACPGAFISVDRLAKTVMAELHRLTDAYLDEELLRSKVVMHSGRAEKANRLQASLAAARRDLLSHDRVLAALYLDKVNGRLDEDDFLRLSADFSAEKQRLTDLCGELARRISDLTEYADADSAEERLTAYLRENALTREAVEAFIDRIAVGKRIPGTRQVPVEITWRF